MISSEMDRLISTTVSEAQTFLRNAERAVVWLEEAEIHDLHDVERANVLQSMWRQIYSLHMRLDEIYPRRVGPLSPVRKATTHHPDGGCPICGGNDGMANVGKQHWHYCSKHKMKWSSGINLYSGWRDETLDEQRRKYNEIGLGGFEKVEPIYPDSDPNEMVDVEPALVRLKREIDGLHSKNDLLDIAAYSMKRTQDQAECPF